jgi:hypothetical protein
VGDGALSAGVAFEALNNAAVRKLPLLLILNIDGADELRPDWFRPDDVVLMTAGASAPEQVVQGCVTYLCERLGAVTESRVVREEEVRFALPRVLR